MSNPVGWQGATSRSTGISSASINTGAGSLGSEIDNATNLDKWMSGEVVFTPSSTPAEGDVWEIFNLLAVGGTNYEDGGTSVQPVRSPDASIAVRTVSGQQRIAFRNVPIPPFKFKPLLWNGMSYNATGVTLTIYTHKELIS